MIPKSCIIVGGGYSKVEGIEKRLYDKIKNKFTIACNILYKKFDATIVTFVDKAFFESRQKELKQLPFATAKKHGCINPKHFPNFYLFKTTNKFLGRNSLKENKVYSSFLVGLFSITVAIALKVDEIFILGFDFGDITGGKKDSKGRILTHSYQNEENMQHAGLGNVRSYETRKADPYFTPFLSIKDCEIFNVSLKSHIACFKKITYDEFFEKIKQMPNVNQNELREEIKKLIEPYAIRD